MCDVTLRYYIRNYSEGALLDLIMDSTGDTNKDMLAEIVAAFAIVKDDVRHAPFSTCSRNVSNLKRFGWSTRLMCLER